MKLTFLGTAAAEMYPNAFCECPNCSAARRLGGRNVRGNSAMLVDGDILMDFNLTCQYVAAQSGLSMAGIRHLFITHPHEDHFIPVSVKCRRAPLKGIPPFDPQSGELSARFTPLPPLTIHGNAFAHEAFQRVMTKEILSESRYDVSFSLIEEGVETGADDISFVALRANHASPAGFCHNYILLRGGKTLLYAVDTGGYDADQLDILKRYKYDGVVLEGTFGLGAHGDFQGDAPIGGGHMTLKKNIVMRDYLIKNVCITQNTPFLLTHLCPHYAPPHDEYAEMVRKYGFTLAYDGMVVLL